MSPPHAALLFVLLLIPSTTLRDWQAANAPQLHRLMAGGCLALMNARTAEFDRITPLGGCYTLAAGARMGDTANVVGLGYAARADNLPAALRGAGVQITAIGPLAQVFGEPTPASGSPHPPAPSPAGGRGGEERGFGNGPHPPTPSPNSRGGGTTAKPNASIPPPRIGGREAEGREEGQGEGLPTFIAVDLGSDPAKADSQIGAWAERVARQGGELMVVSPNPSDKEYRTDDQLTPVLIVGPRSPKGTLISPSTHQLGLGANTDIAPTIAAYFGARLPLPPFGAPLQVVAVPKADVAPTLLQADEIWQFQAQQRRAVPYIAGLIALSLAASTILGMASRRTLGGPAVLFAAIPLTLLMSSTVSLFSTMLLCAIGAAFALRKRPWKGIVLASGATMTLVAGDALFAAGRMTAHSLLGYSPMEGARYYGVGNEAMGALVGAAVVVTGALAAGRKGWLWPASIWLGIAVALGLPGAGAKAGGFLVALVALAAFIASYKGWSFWRPLPCLFTLAVLTIGGLMLVFVGSQEGHTHIGQALALAHVEGYGALLSIAGRKAAMDGHLVFHSVWILALIAAAGGAALLYRQKAAALKQERVIIVTGIATAAACLALNDAGVVAAAICSLYLWAYCAVAPVSSEEPATG